MQLNRQLQKEIKDNSVLTQEGWVTWSVLVIMSNTKQSQIFFVHVFVCFYVCKLIWWHTVTFYEFTWWYDNLLSRMKIVKEHNDMAESLEQKKKSLITQLEMVWTLNLTEKLKWNIRNKNIKKQVITSVFSSFHEKKIYYIIIVVDFFTMFILILSFTFFLMHHKWTCVKQRKIWCEKWPIEIKLIKDSQPGL